MDTIQISDIFKIIRRRIFLIISIVIFAVLAAGLINFYILEPEYEATATLIVQPQKESNRNQNLYNDLLAGNKLVKTYGEIVKSRRIAEDVIQKLKLDLMPEQLLKKLRVQSVNESLIISITFSSVDPSEAVTIVNGFADSLNQNLNSVINVDNVSILDYAQNKTNPMPVQPKQFMNMAIALILGIMAGVTISLYLEFNDKTIRTEDDIENSLGLPVLGVVVELDKKNNKRTQRKESPVGGSVYEIKADKRQSDILV